MPIIPYQCQDCKKEFDVFYTSQDAIKKEEKSEQCPDCKSKKKKRMVSTGTGFILKGKGWAKDGYK